MGTLRVVGDCHGHIITKNKRIGYADIVAESSHSVQLGDFGYDYSYLDNLYYQDHVVILGNHENYYAIHNELNLLTSYGRVMVGNHEFFYVRGGFSIDMQSRVAYEQKTGIKTWYSNEQLSVRECEDCLEEYNKIKPRVVMSHSCPAEISELVGEPGILKRFGWPENMTTQTQHLLQFMFDDWQPELWIFGHYHKNWKKTVKGTNFMCIAELDYVDFGGRWNIL